MIAQTRMDSRRRADRVLYQLVYCATFPFFLVGAGASRLLLGSGAKPASHPSIFGEAQAAARTCGSFALMG